ncbi:heavy-metal-associated domain-containing protein [Bosea sp. 2YAB26]|uniref:heavy-metal-associated domain-containing protein n=1 Tax=Bosea sp. 2YAB26 TaxID=3237478 RepID=UPI003F93BBD2
MTCGHCAGTIKSAIESSIPGAKVSANPEARLVSVEGADLARVREIIARNRRRARNPAPPRHPDAGSA